MYRLLCSLSLLVVLFGCAIRPPDSTREFTSQEIAKRLIASTVYIKVVKRDSDSTFSTSYGSGFVIRPGYVATNYHVVDKMHLKFSSVRLVSSERELPIERIIDINKDYDLATIQCARVKATALPLGDSDKVQIGETVYVSGNPKGFTGTFSAGVISAIRDNPFRASDDIIQITAPVSSGSSGGPVMNTKGQVIGVVRSRVLTGQNINFAAPINILRIMIQDSVVNP